MFLPSNITLKFGDSGDFVSELQRRLSTVHCFSGDPSGFFDGVTVNGVSQFQSMSGIRADGIAGPETLRRLNGTISGDTSSTDERKAEEERKAQELANQQLAQQRLLEQQPIEPAYPEPAAELVHHHAPQLAEVNYVQPQAYETQQHLQEERQYLHEQQQHLHDVQHQAVPNSRDVLAHMLVTPQPTAQAQPQPPTEQPLPSQAHPHAASHHPSQAHTDSSDPTHRQTAAQATKPVNLAPAPAANLIPPAAAAPVMVIPVQAAAVSNVTAAEAVPALDQPRGMADRAMHYASNIVQKLATYFKSTLRPDDMEEVKQIGMAMAKSGVREAAIPMGIEPQRGMDIPSRGPQQAQGQQRG